MNRRGFLSTMLKAAVACAVLPAATTYARTWKPLPSGIVIPEYPGALGVLNTQLTLQWDFGFLGNQLEIVSGIMRWDNDFPTPIQFTKIPPHPLRCK